MLSYRLLCSGEVSTHPSSLHLSAIFSVSMVADDRERWPMPEMPLLQATLPRYSRCKLIDVFVRFGYIDTKIDMIVFINSISGGCHAVLRFRHHR